MTDSTTRPESRSPGDVRTPHDTSGGPIADGTRGWATPPDDLHRNRKAADGGRS
jgi:hypothetical protein